MFSVSTSTLIFGAAVTVPSLIITWLNDSKENNKDESVTRDFIKEEAKEKFYNILKEFERKVGDEECKTNLDVKGVWTAFCNYGEKCFKDYEEREMILKFLEKIAYFYDNALEDIRTLSEDDRYSDCVFLKTNEPHKKWIDIVRKTAGQIYLIQKSKVEGKKYVKAQISRPNGLRWFTQFKD